MYTVYFAAIVAYYGLPIHIIRELYMTVRSFVIRINDIIRYRQATNDMENKYPTVSAAELAASPDKVCIICREEMEATREGPKKLPCGHFFHLRCLRSWLERQQACPTCRKPIITNQEPIIGNQFPGNVARVINQLNLRQQEQDGQNRIQPAPHRINNAEPVMYVAPENIVPVEGDREERYVLRDTMNTDRPVYLEPVNVRMTPSNSSVNSLRSQSETRISSYSSSNEWRLESLEDQIKALAEVQDEIDILLNKAKSLQEAIKVSTSNQNIAQDEEADSSTSINKDS